MALRTANECILFLVCGTDSAVRVLGRCEGVAIEPELPNYEIQFAWI